GRHRVRDDEAHRGVVVVPDLECARCCCLGLFARHVSLLSSPSGRRSLEQCHSTAKDGACYLVRMRVALVVPALVAALVASLLAAGAAPAKNQPSTIYVDRSGGYRITVPRTWQVVPPSAALVKQTITKLKKQKKTDLAAAYSDMISTAAGRKELTTFRFR